VKFLRLLNANITFDIPYYFKRKIIWNKVTFYRCLLLQITRLQSQLSEREQMLGHYKEQLDSQIAHITQEHKHQQQNLLRQLDMLNSELQQTKSVSSIG
jgi:hypothetical protein